MARPPVALSRIKLEQDEALHLKRLLLSRSYSSHIEYYIKEVVEKMAASPTIELGGMALECSMQRFIRSSLTCQPNKRTW